ncbi:hypothetical protein ACFL2Q_09425 [Thermodesulfobacteriota bacterium]
MWEANYHKWRDEAALCLDLLGYFPSPEVGRELREALLFKDPKLQYYAASGLLRQGKEVDRQAFFDMAGSDEVRNWLYAVMKEKGKLSLFPEKYNTQEAFARCAMVLWLVYPTELGRVPDDIELMKVVSRDSKDSDVILDTYLFRFRTNAPNRWKRTGWIAGISGPYARKDAPTIRSLGSSFSSFEPWDKRTPEGHVEYLLGFLEESWKAHVKTLTE